MKWLIALALMWPLAAYAQNDQPAAAAVSSHASTPLPAGFIVHSCPLNQYYPPDLIPLAVSGDVNLSFHVSIDGTVKDISIDQSSGNGELDQAAEDCISHWLYKPEVENGQVVEAARKIRVRWDIRTANMGAPPPPPADAVTAPTPAGDDHVCKSPPDNEVASQNSRGVTILAFQVLTDGSVANVAVQKSSGDSATDQYAIGCVSDWRFNPAIRDGVPVAAAQAVQLVW